MDSSSAFHYLYTLKTSHFPTTKNSIFNPNTNRPNPPYKNLNNLTPTQKPLKNHNFTSCKNLTFPSFPNQISYKNLTLPLNPPTYHLKSYRISYKTIFYKHKISHGRKIRGLFN